MQDVTEEWNQVALLCFRTVDVQKVRKRMKYCFVWCANPLMDFLYSAKILFIFVTVSIPCCESFVQSECRGGNRTKTTKNYFAAAARFSETAKNLNIQERQHFIVEILCPALTVFAIGVHQDLFLRPYLFVEFPILWLSVGLVVVDNI
jgi:hypothetical protein